MSAIIDEMLKFNRDFVETEKAVLRSVGLVRNHPLVPKDVAVHGYIMDSRTGLLTPIPDPEK